jgi:hypothetical protein
MANTNNSWDSQDPVQVALGGSGVTTLTGVVTGNGTSPFTASVLTQHDVLVGGISSAITSVAPSATAGVALVSTGASSDPAFGTVTVPGGGTGAVSLTGILTGNGTSAFTANTVNQHYVLIGGASNAVTSVSPSTAGFVLTSNGVGSDPTFQAVTASGSINQINGNSGSVTPSGGIVTINGGSTGLTTSGSGATLSLTGTLAIANGGTNATSMATSTGIVKYDGTRLVTSSTAKIDSSNRQTNTSQPCFLAYANSTLSNVTGNSGYNIIYDSTVFDQGSNYNTGTGIFTAPVTGRYVFCGVFRITGLIPANSSGSMDLITTAGTFRVLFGNIYNITSGANYASTYSQICTMTAGDTAYMNITVLGNGSNNCSLAGYSAPYYLNTFSGYLLC